MTMPNPVAEVVERLRDVGCDRMPFTDDHAKCVCRLTNKAADLIERLSRERDTGVPTAAANPAACAAAPAVPSYVIVDTPKSEPNLTPSNVFPAEPASRLSAAPQPPTVSPDIVALTRERDQAREALAETRDLIEDLADRALEELKADRERKFDPYDAPDDCESCITVTFGELRKATKRARSVLHPEKDTDNG